MHIQLTDINKRVNSLNSNFIKSEFNLSQMSPTNDKGAFVPSTAKYLIRNWKSFNEDTNKAFELALDTLEEVFLNADKNLIKECTDILAEGVQKVRDSGQLMNSIKHRNSRFKTKIGTKINKKMNAMNSADDELNTKIQSAIAAFKGGKAAPNTSTPAETNDVTGDEKQEAASLAYDKLYNEAYKAYECDRILRNYTTISKRFDLIKMVSEAVVNNPCIEDCIVNICECIDTYNTKFKVKYNTMLEMTYYALNRVYIKEPNDKLIETVTDYFIFTNKLSESDILDIKSVKEHSVLFESDDFKSIDYLFEDKDIDDKEDDLNLNNVSEFVNNYGAEDIVVAEGVKDKIKEWSKGNPDEHKNDDIKKMMEDFRKQCKKDSVNNTTQFKSLINAIFTKNPNMIVNELPNIFSILRLFFIAGSCAINPILGLITLITNSIIKNHLERKNLEKIIDIYKKEIDRVKTKIDSAEAEEEKDRMNRYLDALKKDLDKLKDYERNLYSEEENDERDYADYEFDDDDEWNFEDDEWDVEEATQLSSVLYISDLVNNINEGLIDTDLDGIVYNNIFKFDNDTIDAVTDFSITVPIILEKRKLKSTLESYRDDLRHSDNFMSNIMRIDCLNENIRKLNNSPMSYNVTNNTKGLICTLNWINEMVSSTNCSAILEMNFSNTIKLAMNKLKNTAVKLSDKEKKISNDIDVSMASISRGLEDALKNDSREAIIKGRILPSASKTIKIALATGAAWAVSPAVAVIGAIGAFACSTKLKAKERQLVLDDIEIELKMCERYLKMAEDKEDMEAIRQIEITQRSLERQRQRIKYKMNVVYHDKVPDIKPND